MEKRNKIIYWIATGLLSGLMLMSASLYFTKYEVVSGMFTFLGFPTFVIYPLAIAKILGLVAIWSNKSKLLKEWAYAGFFFDFVLALGAHLVAADGQFGMAATALVLLIVSRIYNSKVFGK
ncbi:DoxX family protein [Labilibaculum euxinus]|uniref:DoxX family protein n=1 Tax=Labilibaculum euxinus TaxID=2686357 RepID=A0A7M4DA07_9BACT|nr:DoxX family protein [Labilibaculum euxinus]MUP39486.1 DoxX family protein [Labilibaculum euxinus]MVB08691.1 DoxX family protein [Labilibaculum euxinus]